MQNSCFSSFHTSIWVFTASEKHLTCLENIQLFFSIKLMFLGVYKMTNFKTFLNAKSQIGRHCLTPSNPS